MLLLHWCKQRYKLGYVILTHSALQGPLYSIIGDCFIILRLFMDILFNQWTKKHKLYSMWLDKAIWMGGINQFDTNTCHHNKKLNQISNHLHLFWDFPKSLINEYSDKDKKTNIIAYLSVLVLLEVCVDSHWGPWPQEMSEVGTEVGRWVPSSHTLIPHALCHTDDALHDTIIFDSLFFIFHFLKGIFLDSVWYAWIGHDTWNRCEHIGLC